MSTRDPGRSLALRASVLAVAMIAAAGCDAPSAGVDGGDLLGVFERDASVDAAAPGDGGVDAGTDAAAPDAGTRVQTRLPPAGKCVAPSGQADSGVRRVAGRPACRDAQVLEWKDAEGAPRYACVYSPRGVSTRAPLPVVVFFHGEQDDPASVAKATGLRKLGARFDMTGDPAHLGFIVLAPQGRRIGAGKLGLTFDADYTGDDNVDAAAADHFVDALVAQGLVDKSRVFAMGASRGARMASTYAMLRPDRVAAFASYGSDAPSAAWSCKGPPPPGVIVYRACDDVAPCSAVEAWLHDRDEAQADTAWIRLGAGDESEPSCTVRNKCTQLKGASHHRRWPKGREEEMLKFLAQHALQVGG